MQLRINNTLSFSALFAVGLMVNPVTAAFVDEDGANILSDDFEQIPASPTDLYQIGSSPVVDGPWEGTSTTSGNEIVSIVARPDGASGQALAYRGKYSGGAEFENIDSGYTGDAAEYFYDFEWMPGVNVRDRSARADYDRFQIADSSAEKGVMFLQAVPVYPNNPGADQVDEDAYNELVVQTGDGGLNLGQISDTEFSHIQLQLTPIDADNQQWQYSLWVDGELKVDEQAFTTLNPDAVKATNTKFINKWKDNAYSYVDNFHQRTDGFATPIPEPGTMALGVIGAGLLLTGRHRR